MQFLCSRTQIIIIVIISALSRNVADIMYLAPIIRVLYVILTWFHNSY